MYPSLNRYRQTPNQNGHKHAAHEVYRKTMIQHERHAYNFLILLLNWRFR